MSLVWLTISELAFEALYPYRPTSYKSLAIFQKLSQCFLQTLKLANEKDRKRKVRPDPHSCFEIDILSPEDIRVEIITVCTNL